MHNLQDVQVRTGSTFETICPFPVGAIYHSTKPTSPADIYAEHGHLSRMVDSLDPMGTGAVLAEKMNTSSLFQKCQVTVTDWDICSLPITEEALLKAMLPLGPNTLQMIMKKPLPLAMEWLTTMFLHTEPVIAGIELPNITEEVF